MAESQPIPIDSRFTAPKFVERFWSKVNKHGPMPADPAIGNCWCWTRGQDQDGYGIIQLMYVSYRSHRVSFELHSGLKIPNGLWVLHRCDNPSCVRPNHLFLGTCADNHADMKAKRRGVLGMKNGRHTHPETTPRGSRNGKSKLTEANVREIRQLQIQGISRRNIHLRTGLPYRAVCHVYYGKTWRHVV